MSSDVSIDEDLQAQLSDDGWQHYSTLEDAFKELYRKLYMREGAYKTVDAIERATVIKSLLEG